jgi:NAD-dependent dihydropyrimidine dehydrogenase PreA subunit
MKTNNDYQKLADHLSQLAMGYPVREDLVDILKEIFTEKEAAVALAVPTNVIPLNPASIETIQQNSALSKNELQTAIDSLVQKNLLFVGKTEEGGVGYALHQVGFGFPQSFFWKGEDTPQARKMAGLIGKYFNRHVTTEAYGTPTKTYRYIPIAESLEPELQAVYPLHLMESVIESSNFFAVAHCPCRVSYKLSGRECDHPLEVCLKFNDLARYLVERGLGREVSKKEALQIIKVSEEAGLVHFVDNTAGKINHNCNCCGCACWNVGNIKRRKIRRDDIMATYFIRKTDEDECSGCGECVEICPVDALEMQDDLPLVDEEWCIGCGVCATVCPTDSARMKIRDDKTGELPAASIKELHEKILKEKTENC